MTNKVFNTTTVNDKGYYDHFGIHPITAILYGHKKEDIIKLKFKIAKNQNIPPSNNGNMEPDYWGWYDYNQMKFSLIYAKWFLLDMCFPSGIKGAEKHNEGKAFRLEVLK